MKQITRVLLFSSLPLIYLACSSESTSIDPPLMWGDLQPGEYSVGYTSLFTFDKSRPAIPYSDWTGKIYPTDFKEGRQMQINLWYPAKSVVSSSRLKFRHYVELMGKQIDFNISDAEALSFGGREFISKTNDLGGNGSFTQQKLDSLIEMNTHAFAEASQVEGKFPLIAFPNGGSPAFNSIMCEYLASHGFVVAAFAGKGSDVFTSETSTRGLENGAQDISFALTQLMEWPQIDRNKIGMMGVGINSSHIVTYQNRNANIDALVSLEGGLLSSFEQRLLNGTPFYDALAVNVPILAIYAPHGSIDPSHIFHLKYSERYFLHFPQMTEFHFINYGQLDRFFPGIIGDHEGDIQRGFELASLYILKFFESILSDNETSAAFIRQGPARDVAEHIDTFFIKPALESPPTLNQLKDAFIRKGFDSIDSVYQVHRQGTETPFPFGMYADIRAWLAWKKDPEYQNRYRLYKLAYDSYPESAEANYYLGRYAMAIERSSEAKVHYRMALELLDKDLDDLSPEQKQSIRDYIQRSIKENGLN